jgi:hypothetical protein
MYANVVTFQGEPDRMQSIGDYFRQNVLPTLQAHKPDSRASRLS